MSEDEFPGWDCQRIEIGGEPLVGLTVYVDGQKVQWVSWFATLELHQWLGELISAAPPAAAARPYTIP